MEIDLNIMATNIQNVLSVVPGIAAAYDHEPQQLNPLPSATIYFDGFSDREDTIGRIEYDWKWTIRIYIGFTTTDIKEPQLTIRTLTTEVLKAFRSRANFTLNETCLYQAISAGDIYNIVNVTNPMMVSELTLIATTQETRG
jgi:hypothetical protein